MAEKLHPPLTAQTLKADIATQIRISDEIFDSAEDIQRLIQDPALADPVKAQLSQLMERLYSASDELLDNASTATSIATFLTTGTYPRRSTGG